MLATKLEIQSSFSNNTSKNDLIEIKFLKKYLNKKSRIFVDKKTGIIRSDLKSSPEEILDIWSKKIFNSKNINDYSAFLPFARSRLYYTALTLIEFLNKKNIKKRIYCDYASGQGVLIDILQKIEKKKIIIATEGSKELSKNIEKKYNINCLNVSLGSGQIKEKNNNINPNIGFLNWTLCNCIDPLSVLRDVHNHLDKNAYLCIAESSRILVPFKKKLEDYFNKRYVADIHPWHFSKNSLKALLGVAGFNVKYVNYYKDSDVMLMIAKKTDNKRKFYKVDSYKDINSFFKDWKYLSDKNYLK